MAKYLVASTPVLPDLPVKITQTIDTPNSREPSIHSQYFTPRPSIQNEKSSSDSSSTLTDHSSNDESVNGDFLSTTLKKHVRFSLSSTLIETHVKIEDDEAEFFAVIPTEDSTKNNDVPEKPIQNKPRKRDRIRAMFARNSIQSNGSDSSDAETNEWGEMLAKSLIKMQQDVHEIISGIDEIDQPITDNTLSTTSDVIVTSPRLSFRERQRAKIEMIRMAQMLHPPNLLTYDVKESPYPYTDIVAPHNYTLNFLHHKKQVPFDNLLVQHKPIRHEKLRYRTQRGLLKMRRDLKQLKYRIYGKTSSKSRKELPSVNVQHYRTRLEKTLNEVRTQIAEYDRVHATLTDHRQSISQIIAQMKAKDPLLQAQIEDYRTKLRPIAYVEEKRKNDLISAPFIPRRAKPNSVNVKKETNEPLIDKRFDPTTFIDLNEEATDFFGTDVPFWDESSPPKSPVPSPPSRRQTYQFELPPKTGLLDRFVHSFKTKQNELRLAESLENDSDYNDNFLEEVNEDDNDSCECTYPSNTQQQTDELESVEF